VCNLANTRRVTLLDYTFVPAGDADGLSDAIDELFGALRSNGQLWGPYVCGRMGDSFRVTCQVPRRDALAEKYESGFAKRSLR
jgi:hypothetical protein